MAQHTGTPTGERHLATLEGVLERITYANEENGYAVARVDTGRGAGDLLTGQLAEVVPLGRGRRQQLR
ncbi:MULTISPECIES: hypothetical protein [unclassified Streptomyces]|uniref:YrrC family ATP-dependent DNA helicase n=1 Tax=unclassified Streptomyces TaxID=2593676 RepID=UPI0034384082